MGRLMRTKNDYEDLRNARILQNQVRLNSLGIHNTLFELNSISSSTKRPKAQVRNYNKKVYDVTSLRRSDRLKGTTTTQAETSTAQNKTSSRRSRLTEVGGNEESEYETKKVYDVTSLRRSDRLKGTTTTQAETSTAQNKTSSRRSRLTEVGGNEESEYETKKRPANAPFVEVKGSRMELVSSESWARRCDSKSRGSVYHSVLGICCHFCRKKKLCGEEDCKRCGTLDMDQPCIGKTDCSVCHSTNGVLCRGCLKVRYGEEMEEVRENKDWMCPHCIEEKGVRPYWICNSSFCMKKRKMAPTGIAI